VTSGHGRRAQVRTLSAVRFFRLAGGRDRHDSATVTAPSSKRADQSPGEGNAFEHFRDPWGD